MNPSPILPNAVPVANFTITVSEVYKGKDGQKVKKTHWFKVTAFQRLAEIVGSFTLPAILSCSSRPTSKELQEACYGDIRK